MSLNILIVDDSATMRRMITRTLHLSGLPVDGVFEAANGREGLLALAKNRIDLALIDINMPEMNGEEMIARIRQNPTFKDVAVVIVSTEGSTTRIASLMKEAAVGFVHKPFTPERLSQVVYEVTGGTHGNAAEEPSEPVSGPDF
jgi:two-component system chemotaxis response regulator CheY